MLNHIVLMGRLTRDPELRRTGSGVAVASFSLAVDRDFASQGAEKETDFIDIVAWRNTAEFVSKYFTKGRMTRFAWEDINSRERLLDDLGKIETSNKFLLSLINDVLDISKIDSGKIELNPEPYPYAEYTASIRNMCQLLSIRWLRNFNRMCIDYASRPRLSSRLTLGGRTFPKKP